MLIRLIRLLLWGIPWLLSAACATFDAVGPAPAPVGAEPETQAATGAGSPPDGGTVAPETAPPVPQPAVLALAGESDARLRAGEPEQAAAALERALRLSPGDAGLWHRLARVRMAQGRWQQAIVLARKSDSLASASPELRRENARLVDEAERQLRTKE